MLYNESNFYKQVPQDSGYSESAFQEAHERVWCHQERDAPDATGVDEMGMGMGYTTSQLEDLGFHSGVRTRAQTKYELEHFNYLSITDHFWWKNNPCKTDTH